jgi:Protein of unknown function (DUF3301)
MLDALLPTILILLVFYLWQGALRARERARALAHEICAHAQLQLLDQTVSLQRVSLARGGDGRLHLRRRYRFELSTDGLDRQPGSLETLEDRLLSCSLPLPPEYTTEAHTLKEASNVVAFGRTRGRTLN